MSFEPRPARMPRVLVLGTVTDMEPHERQFVPLDAVFVDRNERVWLDAEATILPRDASCIQEGYAIAVRRTGDGVELRIPQACVYPPQKTSPFKSVLTVTKAESVALEEF